MAIEFEHRGKKYRADTAKEAAELQYHLEQHDALHGTYSQLASRWTPDQAMELLSGIGTAQKKFLHLLSDGRRLQSTSLVEGIGLDSEIALAGVISGLSKQVRKMSMSPHDVYRVEVRWKGKGKERFFTLSPDLRDVFVDLGWPEAWDAKNQK